MNNFPRISSFMIICILGAFTLFMGGCGGSDNAETNFPHRQKYTVWYG